MSSLDPERVKLAANLRRALLRSSPKPKRSKEQADLLAALRREIRRELGGGPELKGKLRRPGSQ